MIRHSSWGGDPPGGGVSVSVSVSGGGDLWFTSIFTSGAQGGRGVLIRCSRIGGKWVTSKWPAVP